VGGNHGTRENGEESTPRSVVKQRKTSRSLNRTEKFFFNRAYSCNVL
jgi:hypothetical protein